MPAAAAGWYPDPQLGGGHLRYWDGAAWTEHVSASGSLPQPMQAVTVAPQGQSSGKAIAALVLGIVGMFAWFIPLFGLPINVTGLILGITATKSARRTMAIVGVVLCVIGLLLTIVNAAWGAYLGATGQHPLVQWLQQ